MGLADDRPGAAALPAELQEALREWVAAAGGVGRSGGPGEHELLRERGRQLAGRVADALGRPVRFVDPLTGASESIPVGSVVAGATHLPASGGIRLPERFPQAAEPTPWATGLAVAAFFAVLVAIGDVQLSGAFAEAFGLLWVPANLLVGLGLSPSLYLLRAVPFWRWPALGAVTGLGAAWVVLLLALLGP